MNMEIRSGIKKILPAALFCLALSIGTVCFADGKGADPETQAQSEESAQQDSPDDAQGVVYMDAEEPPYVMPGFQPVVVRRKDQEFHAYKNGDFYIVYARMQDGEEGWFLYDHQYDTYQRYVYTAEGAEMPDSAIEMEDLMDLAALGMVIALWKYDIWMLPLWLL